VPRRISVGVDRYTSLAASADGGRVVATRTSPRSTLWRLPIVGGRADMTAARRVALTTSGGSWPRLGDGYLLYVSSKGASDSIWKLQNEKSTELWTAPEARVIGAPAIARGGSRVAFSIRQGGQTSLLVMNADGTEPRVVARDLDLQGSPAWAPDGQSITVAAAAGRAPRLVRVPLDGRTPEPIVADYSLDPAWTPDGELLIYSGPDIGTTFPVKAVTRDAKPHPLSGLTLSRGARHLAFIPGQRALVVLRGEIRHKNLWAIDLDTGAERPLTDLAADFDVRDFDLSPDGREIVLEQVEQRSDIVLIERSRP
jgi:Tol biopolymer transport system component